MINAIMQKRNVFFIFSKGWEGKTCEDNIDECETNPCLNGGMCMDTPGDYICSCPFGNFLFVEI